MAIALTNAHDKAVADLQKLLRADGNDSRALLRLAELHTKANDLAIACETYARAGDVFVKQGFARRALSAFAQALEVARKAKLVERVAPIARAMAKLYVKEKLPREATTTLDGAVRFLIEKGADAEAARLLEERIALEDTEIARVRLAETFFRMGDPDRAASQLVGVWKRLYDQGRRDEALDVAERLLGERCDVAIARASAEMYLARNRSGDPFLALAKLRICCSKDPTHVPTLELLARAFDQAGHADKATRVRGEIAIIAGKIAKALPAAATKAKPKAKDDSVARAVDAGWDDIEVEVELEASASERIDPSRASFWPADEGPAPDRSGSVVSVSVTDVELVDHVPPASEVRAVSLFETVLECVESLVAQERFDDALLLVARHLTLRPHNTLLLERRAEIEEMKLASHQGPPAALFGFTRADSQRSIVTSARAGR